MENLDRFYEWMLAIGNIHIASNEKMTKAYERIIESDAKAGNVRSKN
jgi:hypothetical protein